MPATPFPISSGTIPEPPTPPTLTAPAPPTHRTFPAVIRSLLNASALIGIDLRKLARSVRGLPAYWSNRREFLRGYAQSDRAFPPGKTYPCLTDRFESSGVARGDYFHQDLLVAQWIHRNNPERHVDVGSRVDGFVAHVAAFRPVEVLDIRPLHTSAANISFRQADLMAPGSVPEADTDSLSCLHTLEHFGLGRYGDPVRYDGYKVGWDNLHRMLKPGGKLYFSVPIGSRQRFEFDAHRVFSVPFLKSMMKDRYRIDAFAYVDDAGELHADADPGSPAAERSFDCTYGCGIFQLTKHTVPPLPAH